MMNFLRTFCFLLLTVAFANVQAQPGLHPDKGLAMIWYGDQDNINDRDGIVTVGQIFYMWRWFEPAEGDYQFEDLEKQLNEMSQKGMKATIQINGNRHPDYIFQIVPYLDGVALPSQYNHTQEIGFGPPMYWHPTYKERYKKMIDALAYHIKNSSYKDAVLGIRQSYNAVGTEHHYIPPEYREKSAWTFESGVTEDGDFPWTNEISGAYKRWTIDMYLDAFNPPEDINVFIRASAIERGEASSEHIKMVENGDLWIFHTSSEPQPRSGKVGQYQVFVDYAKTGKTYAFMESWSSAQTNRDDWDWSKTATPVTKEQWNYWTLLVDLHCGATWPAMRPEDIDYPSFREHYEFAAKYAGYTMEPEKSPGAWIAFREGDWLVGDYTFLMERTEKDSSEPLYNVDDSKYGLWAREIKGGESMELSIQDDFLQSLSGTVTVKVWYNDEVENKITFDGLGEQATVNLTGAGDWKIAVMDIRVSDKKSLFRLGTEKDMIVHKIQIEK